MKFSDSTATLLKTPFLNELNWLDETGNTLELTSIKQLKGCRTTLVQDCLKFIQKLDVLAEAEGDEKNYALANIKALIEALHHYKISCERYPRLKDFLNIIPDNVSGVVGFFIIASALASIAFPPLAAIPLFIFSWMLIDLFFNNREVAKNLQETLYMLEDDLRTIDSANNILKIKVQPPTAVQTPPSSPIMITPSTSHSSRMYGSVNQRNPHTTNTNSPSTSFTPSG